MMFHLALPSALFTFKEEMPVLALLFRFPNASTKNARVHRIVLKALIIIIGEYSPHSYAAVSPLTALRER